MGKGDLVTLGVQVLTGLLMTKVYLAALIYYSLVFLSYIVKQKYSFVLAELHKVPGGFLIVF